MVDGSKIRIKENLFRIAHGEGADLNSVAELIVDKVHNSCRPGNFGWVYASDHFAPQFASLISFFREKLEIPKLIGTVGIGVCGGDTEYFDRPAITLMTTDIPRNSVKLFASADKSLEDFLSSEADWLNAAEGGLGIFHGDPRDTKLFEILPWFGEACGSFLVGGLTSSRGPYPQAANVVAEGGASGALFSPAIKVATGLTQGCSPIGPIHEITSVENNIIFQLDERPAVDVFKEDIGDLLARDLAKTAGYIFAARPIRGADWGDYMVRNVIGIDEARGWIAIGDDFSDGGSLMFCRRDQSTARRDLDRMLLDLQARIGNATPRGALYYTCVARGPNMFGENDTELKAIQNIFPGLPLIGLFANGEISAGRLYTYTGVLTIFL